MQKKNNAYATIFFDFDGTLFDTADDLCLALNRLLERHQKPSITVEQLRPMISLGTPGMLKLAFNIEPTDIRFTELRYTFLKMYEKTVCHHTKPYPDILDLLNLLELNQFKWGIITNKLTRFTIPILEKFKLDKRCACLVGADTINVKKPSPEPLLHASELTSNTPTECLYIGDSENDIVAAKAAGMESAVALYGYIPNDINPTDWEANYYFQSAQAIIDWINN